MNPAIWSAWEYMGSERIESEYQGELRSDPVSMPQFQARMTGFPDRGISVHSSSGKLSTMQE